MLLGVYMPCSSMMNTALNEIVSTLSPEWQAIGLLVRRVSLGSKLYKTGTVTGQVFRRNSYDRNTATLTDSILGKWL